VKDAERYRLVVADMLDLCDRHRVKLDGLAGFFDSLRAWEKRARAVCEKDAALRGGGGG